MLPFTSRRSSTLLMSNLSYLASRTPRATFSKSQNTAMLRVSFGTAMARASARNPERLGARHLCATVTPDTSISTRRSGWKQATIWPRGSFAHLASGATGMLEPIPSATIFDAGNPLVTR